MSKMIARKGEKVTRENGEYICRVARDLCGGDIPRVADFEDWQIEKPIPHSPFDPYEPGESYIRTYRFPPDVAHAFGADIHLERGWITETDPPEDSERPD